MSVSDVLVRYGAQEPMMVDTTTMIVSEISQKDNSFWIDVDEGTLVLQDADGDRIMRIQFVGANLYKATYAQYEPKTTLLLQSKDKITVTRRE